MKNKLTLEDFQQVNSKQELLSLIKNKEININKVLTFLDYQEQLKALQIELLKLQQWISVNKKRVVVIFEGRDAAGKGGTIRRFAEHLDPRFTRTVALAKPSETEQGQWYFRRYIRKLPNPGEIVFFDRSWYNRAVVEPVMGFCTDQQYKRYMFQVPEFEHMLYEDGVNIIKFWFSISKEEQAKRFEARMKTPLKRWKFSPVDIKGQEYWDKYTYYKEQMFSKTHNSISPWIIVKTNDKKTARLESMRYLLSTFDYEKRNEAQINLFPDPNIIVRYHRSIHQID